MYTLLLIVPLKTGEGDGKKRLARRTCWPSIPSQNRQAVLARFRDGSEVTGRVANHLYEVHDFDRGHIVVTMLAIDREKFEKLASHQAWQDYDVMFEPRKGGGT